MSSPPNRPRPTIPFSPPPIPSSRPTSRGRPPPLAAASFASWPKTSRPSSLARRKTWCREGALLAIAVECHPTCNCCVQAVVVPPPFKKIRKTRCCPTVVLRICRICIHSTTGAKRDRTQKHRYHFQTLYRATSTRQTQID